MHRWKFASRIIYNPGSQELRSATSFVIQNGRGWRMLEYRVFLVGSDGHIKAAEELTCDTDQEACERASKIMTACPVQEVWREDQKVAVIPSDGETEKRRIA
jgi:hypothetical protein